MGIIIKAFTILKNEVTKDGLFLINILLLLKNEFKIYIYDVHELVAFLDHPTNCIITKSINS